MLTCRYERKLSVSYCQIQSKCQFRDRYNDLLWWNEWMNKIMKYDAIKRYSTKKFAYLYKEFVSVIYIFSVCG